MKKLLKNSGFTLLECIVAMAVLAVMTLGLLMILNVTVKQRNQNSEIERSVDNQAENIVQGNFKVDNAAFPEADIDFGVYKITGAKKVYFDGADSSFQLGAVYYVDVAPAIPGGDEDPVEWQYDNADHWKIDGSGNETDRAPHSLAMAYNENDHWNACSVCKYKTALQPHAFESGYCKVCGYPEPANPSKVYGYLDIQNNRVSFNQISATPDAKTGMTTVNLQVKFTPIGDVGPEYSVKVVFPEDAKLVSYTVDNQWNTSWTIHNIGTNIIRIEPKWSSSVNTTIEFQIPTDIFDSYTPNFVSGYFGSTSVEMNS